MDLDVVPDAPHDGVVRWVASQSTNPALQALIREAEREKQSRPSTPVQEPASWSHPLTSKSSSSVPSSSWHPAHSAPYLLPLSSGSSSSSLPTRASDPSVSRRAKPASAAQRKPLASSTSSANQPRRDSARQRSSSHSNHPSNASTSKTKYMPQEEEPEAVAFVELLRDVSRQLDENSKKKQRLVSRTRDKERDRSLTRPGIGNRTGLHVGNSSARPLTKTSSASAIGSVALTLDKLETRGRVVAKAASLDVDLVSGKSTPTSLPSPNLNCDLKLTLPLPPASVSNPSYTAAYKASVPKRTSDDGDSPMQGVIDLTESDAEWEKPMSSSITAADTTTYMDVDDEECDARMDMSFIQAEPPPQTRVAAPKPRRSHPPPAAPTQRAQAGPPPLGMRRAPQLQSSQYNASPTSKSLTVPRFKPPLLANTAGTTIKNGNRTTSATTINPRLLPRGGTTKVATANTAVREDADSSFDVSFGVDADALEEAMRAYD